MTNLTIQSDLKNIENIEKSTDPFIDAKLITSFSIYSISLIIILLCVIFETDSKSSE